jgi:hypothetical protein
MFNQSFVDDFCSGEVKIAFAVYCHKWAWGQIELLTAAPCDDAELVNAPCLSRNHACIVIV